MTADQPIRSREGLARKPGLGAASLSDMEDSIVSKMPLALNELGGVTARKNHDMRSTVKEKHVRANKDISAQRIQRAWLSHMDKTIFQLLKHTVCAAECCVTHEILKKVSPLEAELLKDPSMKCKVRFRFSGETFPPFIVFKIFLHTEGHGNKYFSGRNLFKPSNEGVADACKMMGKKKFYHQVMEDEHLFQKFKITDEIDIVTLKDYMQYSSLLDETPASSGGRNNYWRKLNLKNIPRTMIIYDIVDYAESGIISNRLQKEMKYLLQRPQTEEMRQHQLQIVSEVRCPSSFSAIKPLYRPYQQQNQIKHLGRRSKQAQMKVEKMKKAYKMAKEKTASMGMSPWSRSVLCPHQWFWIRETSGLARTETGHQELAPGFRRCLLAEGLGCDDLSPGVLTKSMEFLNPVNLKAGTTALLECRELQMREFMESTK
ncbi:PREDICTED: putative uncharacterized protein CXorf58 homolog [Odobenus rosmarus divergens]|uniref:Uncharacterized protein n=1 Tax=Odobenus rosmarus divergens TaxID=9708 RepID=A0A9B0H2Y5_ODORO